MALAERVPPVGLRQTALRAASREQVVPGRQQKFSPGHATVAGSAHPRWVEVQQRSKLYLPGPLTRDGSTGLTTRAAPNSSISRSEADLWNTESEIALLLAA